MNRRRVIVAIGTLAATMPNQARAQSQDIYATDYSTWRAAIQDMVLWVLNRNEELAGAVSRSVDPNSDINGLIDAVAPYVAIEAALALANRVVPPDPYKQSHELFTRHLQKLVEAGTHTRKALLTLNSDMALAEFGRAKDSLTKASELLKRSQDVDPRIPPETGAEDEAPVDDGTVSLSGAGVELSDGIFLSAGRYRVDVSLRIDGNTDAFGLWFHDPSGDRDLIFNEFIESPGTWEGSGLVEVGASGECLIEVVNTDADWSITISPIAATISG